MTGGRLKRVVDVGLALGALVLLAPVLAVIAIIVRATSGNPVLFRQERIGLGGRPFEILKFRTMAEGAEGAGPGITAAGDRRVTRVGRFLRRTKLDELPQLWNVLRGEMSLVGPRPEIPRYVARYTADQRRVLDLTPGITDEASLEFRDEEELLARADDMESYYIAYCIPRKIDLNLRYAERANVWSDLEIIVRTVMSVWTPRRGQKQARRT